MKKIRNFFFAAFALGTVAFFSLEGKADCNTNIAQVCVDGPCGKCCKWGAGNESCTAPTMN